MGYECKKIRLMIFKEENGNRKHGLGRIRVKSLNISQEKNDRKTSNAVLKTLYAFRNRDRVLSQNRCISPPTQPHG